MAQAQQFGQNWQMHQVGHGADVQVPVLFNEETLEQDGIVQEGSGHESQIQIGISSRI